MEYLTDKAVSSVAPRVRIAGDTLAFTTSVALVGALVSNSNGEESAWARLFAPSRSSTITRIFTVDAKYCPGKSVAAVQAAWYVVKPVSFTAFLVVSPVARVVVVTQAEPFQYWNFGTTKPGSVVPVVVSGSMTSYEIPTFPSLPCTATTFWTIGARLTTYWIAISLSVGVKVPNEFRRTRYWNHWLPAPLW